MTTYPLAERLGLPRLAGNGRLLAALAIDALGSGLYLPFVLLFLVGWTGLGLVAVGATLTIARTAAIPLGLFTGPLTDRLGPRPTLALSGAAQAAALGGYLISDSVWEIGVFSLLAALGDGAFWVSIRSMTAAVVPAPQRPRWLGAQIALRNATFALGGVIATTVMVNPSRYTMMGLAAANAASFAVLALLIGTWRPRMLPDEPLGETSAPPSFRVVLADRAYLLFVAVNLLLVFAMTTPGLLLAVYVGEVLHGPLWLVGACFTLETVLIALGQTVVAKAIERRSRSAALRWAVVAFAASFALLAALPVVPALLLGPGLIAVALLTTMANLLEGPSGIGIVTDAASDQVRGRYTAIYQLTWNVGKALTPGLAAWLLARAPSLPWLALLGCCTVAYILLLKLGRILPPSVDVAGGG